VNFAFLLKKYSFLVDIVFEVFVNIIAFWLKKKIQKALSNDNSGIHNLDANQGRCSGPLLSVL
jgi:hypothetical protein